jgi:hypothetical protein
MSILRARLLAKRILVSNPTKRRSRPYRLVALVALTGLSAIIETTATEATFKTNGESYRYVVNHTGENYSFEFEKNPGGLKERIPAVVYLMRSVYDDASIPSEQSRNYTRESAKCFVFEASSHTNTACFLPNDYSPEKKDRFWGFVTRVPNWKWLITRNILPALLVIGLLFVPWGRKKPPQPAHSETGKA